MGLIRMARSLFVFSIAAGVLLAVVGLSTGALAQGSRNDALYRAYTASKLPSGKVGPNVIARIGTTTLTSTQFAHRVGVIQYNNTARRLGMTEAQMEQKAINEFIRSAALHERAKAEGIKVSDAEVDLYISQQAGLRAKAFAKDPSAEANFEALLAARGFATAADYDNAVQTRDAARSILETGALIHRHVGDNATTAEIEAFVQATIQSADVHVYYTP